MLTRTLLYCTGKYIHCFFLLSSPLEPFSDVQITDEIRIEDTTRLMVLFMLGQPVIVLYGP